MDVPGKENEEKFLDKVKKGFGKVFKGIKNFFVKTSIRNGSHYYGQINGIGELAVYDDHALIFALGMDDVVFTNENVVGYSFKGLGPIKAKKATVEYAITLDDNVVFPELVRQKNDVKNLTATIMIEKERSHLLGRGLIEDDLGRTQECDIYGYPKSIVIVLNLEKVNGDKVEKYQESVLYPSSHITGIAQGNGKSFAVEFNDGKKLQFTASKEEAYAIIKEMKESQ